MSSKYDASLASGKPSFIWVIGLVWLTSCGYTLNQRLKEGFQNPGGLYVPVFSNSTDEIGAERVFTDALIRELQSRGRMILTHRKSGAFEIQGTVDRIAYSPTNLTPTPFAGSGLETYRRLPTELVVEAAISLRLVDPQNKQVLWSGSFSNFRRVAAILTRTHDYEAPSSVALAQQSLIESQYPQIARDIMRDVYDAMVEVL